MVMESVAAENEVIKDQQATHVTAQCVGCYQHQRGSRCCERGELVSIQQDVEVDVHL